MKQLKVIVMDVDGTLTNSKKEITPKTKEVLLLAQQKGIRLILASGRSTMGLREYAKELEMEKYDGLVVSYNGSKVVSCSTNETLFDEPLTLDEIKRILNHTKKFDITPMIDNGSSLYVDNVDGLMVEYESSSNNYTLEVVNDLECFVDFTSNKILTSGDPDYLKSIFYDMNEPFKNELTCMFTAPFYVEYTAKDIDKAKALDSVLTPLGYHKDEIIAFGDGHNDITMLQYAGIGVAMENAVDELKDIADLTTTSNENDGIANILQQVL